MRRSFALRWARRCSVPRTRNIPRRPLRSCRRHSPRNATIRLPGTSSPSPMGAWARPARPNSPRPSAISSANLIPWKFSPPAGRSGSCRKGQPIGNARAISWRSRNPRSRSKNSAGEESMNLKETLKLAAGGVALFCVGALVTALGLGQLRLPGVALDKGGVEQVVHDYLISHPEIIIEMSKKLDTQQAANDQKTREDALFNV